MHAQDNSSQWLFVGLGNPGPGYARHRHNAGFMVVEQFAATNHAHSWQTSFGALCSKCWLAEKNVRLCLPQKMMNRSGGPVAQMANYYQIPSSCVVVIHDELDLPMGRVRLKQGGGSGGHRGLVDLIKHLGPDFIRLRCGIGRPNDRQEVVDFVLEPFAKQEQPALRTMLDLAELALAKLLTQGLQKTMAEIHQQA